MRYPCIRASNASTQEKGTTINKGTRPAPFGEMILYLPRSCMPDAGLRVIRGSDGGYAITST